MRYILEINGTKTQEEDIKSTIEGFANAVKQVFPEWRVTWKRG